MHTPQLSFRLATTDDGHTLQRLAVLDSAAPLSGRVLLAEADGAPMAAVSLSSGAVIADPFEPTADAVRLLELRRYQLTRQDGNVAPARSLVRRLIPRAS
jgi:hypothetical protein